MSHLLPFLGGVTLAGAITLLCPGKPLKQFAVFLLMTASFVCLVTSFNETSRNVDADMSAQGNSGRDN